MNGIGTHVILDLLDCENKSNLINYEYVYNKVVNTLLENGFSILNSAHKVFDNDSYTFIIALAESHFSIHTWPEYSKVNCDIYTCNLTKNNSYNTIIASDEIINLFKPNQTIKHVLTRI